MAFISLIDAKTIFQKLEKGFIHATSSDKDGDYSEWYFDKLTKKIAFMTKSLENPAYVSSPFYKTKEDFIKFLTEIEEDSYNYSNYNIKDLLG